MAKRIFFVWIGLIALTIITGLVSISEIKYSAVLIMLFAAMKFIVVAFEFMEMKAAHNFWKVALIAFLFIFIIIVLVLL